MHSLSGALHIRFWGPKKKKEPHCLINKFDIFWCCTFLMESSRIIMCYLEIWHTASSMTFVCKRLNQATFSKNKFHSCTETSYKTVAQLLENYRTDWNQLISLRITRGHDGQSTQENVMWEFRLCDSSLPSRFPVFEKCGLTHCVDGRARWRDVNKEMYWKSFTSDSLIFEHTMINRVAARHLACGLCQSQCVAIILHSDSQTHHKRLLEMKPQAVIPDFNTYY